MTLSKFGFLILFVFVTTISYAQVLDLNKTRSQIQLEFAKKNIPKLATQKDGAGLNCDQYKIGDHHIISFFYDLNSTCSLIMEIYQSNIELNKVMKTFNTQFLRVDGTHWTTKDKTTDIELLAKENWFTISYRESGDGF